MAGRWRERTSSRLPALPALAREGIRLRRHYSAAPVCAPARASLLLGVHQGNSGVVRNNRFDQPIEDSHTLGTVMRDAGYDSAAIGKWGGRRRRPEPCAHDRRPASAGIQFSVSWTIWQGAVGSPPNPVTFSNTTVTLPIPSGKVSRTRCPDGLFHGFICRPRQAVDCGPAQVRPQDLGKPSFSCTWLFRAPRPIWWFRGVPFYPSGGGLKGGLQWVKKEGTESVNTAFDAKAEKNKDTYIHPDNCRLPNDVARTSGCTVSPPRGRCRG